MANINLKKKWRIPVGADVLLSQAEACAIARTGSGIRELFGDKANTWWGKLVIAAIESKFQEIQSAAEHSGGEGVAIYCNLVVLGLTGIPLTSVRSRGNGLSPCPV